MWLWSPGIWQIIIYIKTAEKLGTTFLLLKHVKHRSCANFKEKKLSPNHTDNIELR